MFRVIADFIADLGHNGLAVSIHNGTSSIVQTTRLILQLLPGSSLLPFVRSKKWAPFSDREHFSRIRTSWISQQLIHRSLNSRLRAGNSRSAQESSAGCWMPSTSSSSYSFLIFWLLVRCGESCHCLHTHAHAGYAPRGGADLRHPRRSLWAQTPFSALCPFLLRHHHPQRIRS